MGAGSSKISANDFLLRQSRQDLLATTKDIRSFADSIFIYLKSELKMVSYLSLLGSRSSCERFVFILAQDLLKVFERLPVVVGKDKKGFLMFQSVSELTRKEDKQGYTYQYCQQVAQFVTRLFQVYAALSLSVMDNEAMVDLTNEQYAYQAPAARLGFRTRLEGGGLVDNIAVTNSIFRRMVLSSDRNRFEGKQFAKTGSGFQVRYTEKHAKVSDIPINVMFNYNAQSYELLLLFVPSIDYYRVNIHKMKVGGYIIDTRHEFFDVETTINEHLEPNVLRRKFTDMLTQLITDNSDYIASQYKKGRRAVGGPGAVAGAEWQRAVPGQERAAALPVGISADARMHVETFVQLDKMPRPTPHCVTRALQLLSDTGASGICKKSFMGLQVGKSTPGLSELISLFFAVERKSDARPEPYALYERLMQQFANGKIGSTSAACRTDGVLSVRKEATEQMKTAAAAARAMWKFQAKHTADVAKIYLKLFNVKRVGAAGAAGAGTGTGPWQILGIHPSVYEGGLDYIEQQIMPAARELLVDYYSKCEELYQQSQRMLVGQLTTSL